MTTIPTTSKTRADGRSPNEMRRVTITPKALSIEVRDDEVHRYLNDATRMQVYSQGLQVF